MIDCTCITIGADPAVIRFAPCHHHFYRGDKRLTGVTSVIRQTWPLKPSWDDGRVDMAVVENARLRGEGVDTLFSAWLMGNLLDFPVGTREDAKRGFDAVSTWWIKEGFGAAVTQQIYADEDVAGIPDIVTPDRFIWDLKCVSKPEATYELQVGGYAEIVPDASGAGLIHCQFTDGGRKATVRPVIYDKAHALSEWRTLRRMWDMVRRRTA